jgi:uncharacterized membrane protein
MLGAGLYNDLYSSRSPELPISMIPATNGFAIWAVLLAGAAFAAWAEHTPWGRRLSGVLVAILLAMVLSNLRLIPQASPTYDTVLQYLIPISIPLLLFDANLRRIVRETGRLLLAFGVGTFGTIIGVLVGPPLAASDHIATFAERRFPWDANPGSCQECVLR